MEEIEIIKIVKTKDGIKFVVDEKTPTHEVIGALTVVKKLIEYDVLSSNIKISRTEG